ncbi:tetratricopeptide repeat protein [Actinospica robiniae]|uniref:tetratricopeptide repeat protein n=1 Tax=Actinospica robiniae TaxID=304901 RepID=UPI0012FB7826|nr:tetratricopeptide repeat protein [Actinospica robiniae]
MSGDNHGPITTGDFSPITQVSLDPLPPIAQAGPAAGPIGVPGASRDFAGRHAELTELHRLLMTGPGKAHVISGLGGIGKSALAARYTQVYAGSYQQIIWVAADSPASINAGLARLAVALEPHLAAFLTDLALVDRAAAWLVEKSKWLLVLDNVERPADLSELFGRIAPSSGSILVTSRRQHDWERIGATQSRLDVLPRLDALALLAGLVGEFAPTELPTAYRLCELLGFLPLALEQAGAYIRQCQSDVRGYLELFQSQPAAFLGAADLDTPAAATIARVWNVTLEQIAEVPSALELLLIIAWLGPHGIPESLFDFLPPDRRGEVPYALGALADYSMISRAPAPPGDSDTSQRISVHRLVQAVARTADPDDRYREPLLVRISRGIACLMLRAALSGHPEHPSAWPAYRRLGEHAEAYINHATPDTDDGESAAVLVNYATYLQNQGHTARSIELFSRAYECCLRVYGPDHEQTIATLTNMVRPHESAGNLKSAVSVGEAALQSAQNAFSDDNRVTLIASRNLAYALQRSGSVDRAIELFERTLVMCTRSLGADDELTLGTRAMLAGAYATSGDITQAIGIFQHVVADSDRELGASHPDTIAARCNMADAYLKAGDALRAVVTLEQTLGIAEKTLGTRHPGMLTIRSNLANAYVQAGRTAAALKLNIALLKDCLDALGENHHETLLSRINLAMSYASVRDMSQAIASGTIALSECHRVLGDDHPTTLSAKINLANLHLLAGEPELTVRLLEEALSVVRRILTPNDPQIVTTLSSLSLAHAVLGDIRQALDVAAECQALAERSLSDQDKRMAQVRFNLAIVSAKAGRRPNAA